MIKLNIVIGLGSDSYPTPNYNHRIAFNMPKVGSMEIDFIINLIRANKESMYDYCVVFTKVYNQENLPRAIIEMAESVIHVDIDKKQTIIKQRKTITT